MYFCHQNKGNMDIDIREIGIRDLRPNSGEVEGLPRNPRKISKKNLEKLKKSVQDAPEMLRLRELIVVPHGDGYVVIAGNQRLEAAKAVGMTALPCKVLPADTDPAKLREYAIKDNLPFGEDDWEVIASDWDTAELEEWGMSVPEKWKDKPTAEEDDFDDDSVTETVCKNGDIWQLGDHRLMCGDSTDAASVALLMDGQRADICFTSPPYNLMAGGKYGNCNPAMGCGENGAYGEYTDDLSDEDYSQLLIKSLNNAMENCDDALFNVGILKGSKYGIVKMMDSKCDNFFDILVWNKTKFMPLGFESNRGMVAHKTELIFCFNHHDGRKFSHTHFDNGKGVNIFETENNANNEFAKEHHAAFPVALPSYIITNFTDNSVLDLFGGTGTTLIAAEQLGRKCYMMELDPHYCDVIIARWEKFTGKKATKIN